MAKILITENQLDMIKRTLTETGVGNDRYERTVEVDVETYGVKINGQDIDMASCADMELNYIIEQEHRSWGIKGISLYAINGPSEIEIEITPETEDYKDAKEITLTLPFDWDNVEHEIEEGEGVVTIGSEITIKLANDPNGEIFIESIHVPVYTL